jgi:hypothetical protein
MKTIKPRGISFCWTTAQHIKNKEKYTKPKQINTKYQQDSDWNKIEGKADQNIRTSTLIQLVPYYAEGELQEKSVQ